MSRALEESRRGGAKFCSRAPLALALAGLLGACAYDPYVDNVRASPEDLAIQHSQEPGALSGPAAALMRVGDGTRARGDLAAAVTMYRRVATLAPQNPEPYVAMGEALMSLAAYNDSVTAYHDAISRGATVNAYRGLGNALVALDQPALALTQFEEAIRLDQNDVRGRSGKGVALDMMGRYPEAQATYREALEIAPGNQTVLNNLGLSLAFSEQYDEAIDVLRRTALDRTATPRQRQNLALAYGLAGKMSEAAKVARTDLDEDSVQKNLAYYQLLRARKGQIVDPAPAGVQQGAFEYKPMVAPALDQSSPLADPALMRLVRRMNYGGPGQKPAPSSVE